MNTNEFNKKAIIECKNDDCEEKTCCINCNSKKKCEKKCSCVIADELHNDKSEILLYCQDSVLCKDNMKVR